MPELGRLGTVCTNRSAMPFSGASMANRRFPTWAVHRVEIDQHRIHDATHFDELLPLPAIPRKARDLPRCDRADVPPTHAPTHAPHSTARQEPTEPPPSGTLQV